MFVFCGKQPCSKFRSKRSRDNVQIILYGRIIIDLQGAFLFNYHITAIF